MQSKEPNLTQIREKLDEIDQKLAALFEDRMKLSEEVARYKIEHQKPVYDREREAHKLEQVRAMAKNPFNEIALGELFTQIMTISRRYQYQYLGKCEGNNFQLVEQLPTAGAKIVYQGVAGAYTHGAALHIFGPEADLLHVGTWDEAMNMLARGEADYGVFPIENSSAGAVSDIFDLIIKYQNYIVAETKMTINHALLGLPGTTLDQIKTVYSHPQGLMQCSEFLGARPQWRQVSMENTAMAAQKIVADGDVTQAAVASEIAGQIYGLEPLARVINHNTANATRFIVLAKKPMYRLDANKISLTFELPHTSGALYHMLGHFIYNHVSMVMIQSRPILGRNWEYRFFVDIEGSLGEAKIQNALTGLREEAVNFRILGNY